MTIYNCFSDGEAEARMLPKRVAIRAITVEAVKDGVTRIGCHTGAVVFNPCQGVFTLRDGAEADRRDRWREGKRIVDQRCALRSTTESMRLNRWVRTLNG
jgi:hypothetical protein